MTLTINKLKQELNELVENKREDFHVKIFSTLKPVQDTMIADVTGNFYLCPMEKTDINSVGMTIKELKREIDEAITQGRGDFSIMIFGTSTPVEDTIYSDVTGNFYLCSKEDSI